MGEGIESIHWGSGSGRSRSLGHPGGCGSHEVWGELCKVPGCLRAMPLDPNALWDGAKISLICKRP